MRRAGDEKRQRKRKKAEGKGKEGGVMEWRREC